MTRCQRTFSRKQLPEGGSQKMPVEKIQCRGDVKVSTDPEVVYLQYSNFL